jgi:hypothetical protein
VLEKKLFDLKKNYLTCNEVSWIDTLTLWYRCSQCIHRLFNFIIRIFKKKTFKKLAFFFCQKKKYTTQCEMLVQYTDILCSQLCNSKTTTPNSQIQAMADSHDVTQKPIQSVRQESKMVVRKMRQLPQVGTRKHTGLWRRKRTFHACRWDNMALRIWQDALT